jgi:predicted DNA-binding ribbon-helix-helix protein
LQQKVARTINKLIRLVERKMKSSVIKRSVVIAGHKTSVSLEDAFWTEFRRIAEKKNMTLSELAAVIDAGRRQGNLSSAYRTKIARAQIFRVGPKRLPGLSSSANPSRSIVRSSVAYRRMKVA